MSEKPISNDCPSVRKLVRAIRKTQKVWNDLHKTQKVFQTAWENVGPHVRAAALREIEYGYDEVIINQNASDMFRDFGC